jgi:hypothetical protein
MQHLKVMMMLFKIFYSIINLKQYILVGLIVHLEFGNDFYKENITNYILLFIFIDKYIT